MFPESVRAVMREVRAESDRYLATAQRLAPRYGEVAAGGEHFDAFLKGEALASLLRYFGRDPLTAMEAAKNDARDMVKKWNARREWQVARWEGAADTVIETAYRKIYAAIVAAAANGETADAA